MKKIMFNEQYGLQSAVLEGRKTQTRREPFQTVTNRKKLCFRIREGKMECYWEGRDYPIITSLYAIGEVVAIAQRYEEAQATNYQGEKGWQDKMFVKAELMPHHIRITDIRCERLQDISESDCLAEGVPDRASFRALIEKISRPDFWVYNPYVIVYEFKLID